MTKASSSFPDKTTSAAPRINSPRNDYEYNSYSYSHSAYCLLHEIFSTAIANRSAPRGQHFGGDGVPIGLERLGGHRDALDPPVTQNRV